jgi:integrase
MIPIKRTGRPKTGSITLHGDHFDVRITLPDGSRAPRQCLPAGLTEPRARETAAAMTERAEQKWSERKTEEAKVQAVGETFKVWSLRWCDERQRRGHTSVSDDRGRLSKWVWPILGEAQAVAVSGADIERLVESLDNHVLAADLSWKTAANVWGLVTKACVDMTRSKTRSLRIRTDNPAAGIAGPEGGAEKAKVYLYPSEFAQFWACEDVPLRWRRLVALATYLYVRASELRGLSWPDLDLVHGVAHVHQQIDDKGAVTELKGMAARRFNIERALLPLLRKMRAEGDGEGRVFAPVRGQQVPNEEDLADGLRKWLLRAGVDRADLHVGTKDKTRRRMRFHDTRATGITWRAVRGDDALKIMRAAGHKDVNTTMAYIREAEQLGGVAFGQVFPTLVPAEVLPELLPNDAPPGAWLPAFSGASMAIPAGIEPALPA